MSNVKVVFRRNILNTIKMGTKNGGFGENGGLNIIMVSVVTVPKFSLMDRH